MDCPYCGKEMEKGVIQSPRELVWSKKRHLFAKALHPDSVIISEMNAISGTVTANLCRICQKVIIDYGEIVNGYVAEEPTEVSKE